MGSEPIDTSPKIPRVFEFDENSLNSNAATSCRTISTDDGLESSDAQDPCGGILEDRFVLDSSSSGGDMGRPSHVLENSEEEYCVVEARGLHGESDDIVFISKNLIMDGEGSEDSAPVAASPSRLPLPVPPNSDQEEVDLCVNFTKTVALKVPRDSTVEHIKALIQDKEQIDEYSQQRFYGDNRLEDGKSLIDYEIHGHPTLHVILQDSARMTINVEILSTQKNLLIEPRHQDTVRDVKLMIQAKEGIWPDEFDLLFDWKVLAEHRTLASLDLLQQPTFHLVFHTKDHVSVIVDMSSHRVTVGAKFWYTMGDVKAIVGAMMPAQVMSLHMLYQGKQLKDHKTLACYNIVDGSVLHLVSPYAPLQIFVKCSWIGKTVALQVCRSDAVKEVKKKLLHKLEVSMPAEWHHISYAGKRLADDRDLASYGIQENSTLFEIISPRSKRNALSFGKCRVSSIIVMTGLLN